MEALLLLIGVLPLVVHVTPCAADTVIMKNGLVFLSQGTPDKDNSLVYIWDGLKRIVVRDTKVEKIAPDNSYRTGERFQLDQPMVVHGGSMPKEVISVQAGPWNELGRRTFRYLGSKSARPESMEQAIVEIGPHIIRYRGIDGFWLGLLDTNQVSHATVLSLLGRVERKNASERERVVRFLMDVGWYPEVKRELDRLIQDFPKSDLSERAAGARIHIVNAEATQRRSEIELRRKAQQFQAVSRLLKTFDEKGINTPLQLEVREIARRDAHERASDKALGVELRKMAAGLSSAARGFWRKPMAEVLKALDEAPDAVRTRFSALEKARSEPATTNEARFALAMSGYVVGQDAAVSDLEGAAALWEARDAAQDYLTGTDVSARSSFAAKLESIAWPSAAETPDPIHRLELLTRIVQLMPPPRHEGNVEPEKVAMRRVLEDENATPTEYAVRLPPEYHPLRSYPAVVVLHSGGGPRAALDEWAAEASRHGYILVAPEYNVPDQPPDYRYTTSEHAAVELALRDARKRFAIDSDRVFVAGQLIGGNMAWDYGLAHPDLFAGAVVFSGFPAKYVPKYLPHHERLPLFYVIGDLAPAANEVIFNNYMKPMIQKTWDITYVEYYRRGLEVFPEEVPRAFDWMDRHHRDPNPRAYKAVSARTSDDRFYGVVIREFSPGYTTAPEAADVFGQNLNPAEIKLTSSSQSNLIRLDVKGVRRLDVWLSPKLIDFKRKPEIRIRTKTYYKSLPKLDLESMLDDLRLRGDRQQLYWFRVPVE
jgi:pimeloyl-ACP methyl ester carboxylesterase